MKVHNYEYMLHPSSLEYITKTKFMSIKARKIQHSANITQSTQSTRQAQSRVLSREPTPRQFKYPSVWSV